MLFNSQQNSDLTGLPDFFRILHCVATGHDGDCYFRRRSNRPISEPGKPGESVEGLGSKA